MWETIMLKTLGNISKGALGSLAEGVSDKALENITAKAVDTIGNKILNDDVQNKKSPKVSNEENDYETYNESDKSIAVSDERLKDIFGEETPIDCFAKIHSYEFKYTPQAQEIMQGKNHVDDKEHLGVMAQELLENPATSSCVIKDTDGFLKVDTAQLTMANTATIAELSRKVQKLEEMIGER